MSVEDRRKFERFNLRLPTRIKVRSSTVRKQTEELNTTNISSGGAFFSTGKPIPNGTKVQLSLTLLSEKLKKLTGTNGRVQVDGTVVRSDQQGIAVSFNNNYKFISLPEE